MLYIIGNEGSWDDFGSFASGIDWLSAAKGDNIGDVYTAMLNLSAGHSVMEGTRLPITGSAEVELTEPQKPEDINQSTEVWLHRAAVKFTFRMRNNTSRKYTVTDLSLGGMSTAMYLMPKGITMGGKDGKTITAFDAVPDAATYDIVRTLAVELPAKAADATDGEWIHLFDKPVYALEGKLLENNAPKNYPLSITLNNGELAPPMCCDRRSCRVTRMSMSTSRSMRAVRLLGRSMLCLMPLSTLSLRSGLR